jgi:hypothetical protein
VIKRQENLSGKGFLDVDVHRSDDGRPWLKNVWHFCIFGPGYFEQSGSHARVREIALRNPSWPIREFAALGISLWR